MRPPYEIMRDRRSFPVMTGRRIPGRAPWLASWLRIVAETIEGWADRLDDRYEFPLPVMRYEDLPDTITWGNRHVDADVYLPDTGRHDA